MRWTSIRQRHWFIRSIYPNASAKKQYFWKSRFHQGKRLSDKRSVFFQKKYLPFFLTKKSLFLLLQELFTGLSIWNVSMLIREGALCRLVCMFQMFSVPRFWFLKPENNTKSAKNVNFSFLKNQFFVIVDLFFLIFAKGRHEPPCLRTPLPLFPEEKKNFCLASRTMAAMPRPDFWKGGVELSVFETDFSNRFSVSN